VGGSKILLHCTSSFNMTKTAAQKAKRKEKRKAKKSSNKKEYGRVKVAKKVSVASRSGGLHKMYPNYSTSMLKPDNAIQAYLKTLKSTSQSAYRAAATCLLPAEYAPVRVTSCAAPCAIAAPFSFTTRTITENSGLDGFFLTRSPLHSYFNWESDRSLNQYVAYYTNVNEGSNNTQGFPITPGGVALGTYGISNLQPTGTSGTKAQFGSYIWPVRNGQKHYFPFTPFNFHITFDQNYSGQVLAWVLNGDDEDLWSMWTFSSTNTWVGTVGVVTNLPFDTKAGPGGLPFIRMDITVSPGASAGNLISNIWGTDTGWNGASPGWLVNSVPNFDTKIGNVNNINVNALSVLVSDVSTILSKNGTVSGMQINQGFDIPGVCINNLQSYQSLVDNAAQGVSKRRSLETGMYAFMTPEDVEDFSYRKYMHYVSANGTVVLANASTPIEDFKSILAFVLFVETNSGSPIGGTYNRTFSYAVEFQTIDPWYYMTDQTLNSTARSELVDALRACPQFHENVFHLKDIFDFLKNAGKSILGIAPEIADVVSGVFPKTAPILMPGAATLRAIRDSK
jgi:hypothetical protein